MIQRKKRKMTGMAHSTKVTGALNQCFTPLGNPVKAQHKHHICTTQSLVNYCKLLLHTNMKFMIVH